MLGTGTYRKKSGAGDYRFGLREIGQSELIVLSEIE